ncbi:hypothetical protein CBR_g39337 [Chara braunii]|uniref:DUF659 domain-containing protein n=1 Tax=Chara braunii TaxID=69332 RepID=A0A388LRJ1_CHABU|nr:hypothetical protein CBR_g39337 [Chara braunii]|eukprot:GBG84875.1 hypothetical protein CBR_g39337 [Chara braunii]
MTKSRSEAVKKHFTKVGDSGRADKGNKQRICNYCDKPVAGTASKPRDHFLKGSRCDVERLRGVVPREEYSRRVKGRLAARSELGAVTEETAEGGSSEDDNEQRTVEGGVVDQSESAAGLRHATPQSSTGVVGLRQTTMEDNAVVITAHEQTQRTVDDWMTAECIPLHMMQGEYWDRMVHALMNAPKGFRYAKFESARTKRVEVTRGRVVMRVEELRQEWPTIGCMLQLDGWTDRRQRPHINVMVSFPKGSIFWRSVCMSRRNKGASAYYAILKRAIEEIGAEAVVGVVMDNAAICAAAGRMVEADHPHIFSVPCTAHSLDLIFESFAKITWVGEVIKRASEVAKFFTNLSRVRDLLLHYSNGSVVAKPGATRFATNFIMLSSLQGLYLPLRACLMDDDWKSAIVHTSQHELFVRVTHAIFDDTFWADIEKVMQTSKNLLNLLKKVDGAGPTISKVYARMDSAVEKLRESKHFTEAEKDELEGIIMRRWNTMTSPLHCAALFLDPEYRASRPESDAEIVDGFWTWLYSWCKEAAYREVDVEVCSWIESTGRHTTENARTQARTMQPARWWRKWCSDMPILQKQVVQLLGQGSSSSSCERNWSLFERIHSRLRNNLGAVKLSTLVFNRWNQHLLDLLTKKPKADDAAKWEEDEPMEDLTRDDMASDAHLRLGEWRARLRGTHSVHDEVQHRQLRSELFELERELNESWRKATKASKFLARKHLHDLDQATRTMTLEHANKYKVARAAACAPPSVPAKRGRGRPRKDAATHGGTGDEEIEDAEGGDLEGVGAPTRATRKRGRPRKAPVEEEEAGNRRETRKRGRLQVQPAEEEEEAAFEKTSSADKHGSSDGSSSSDESGAEHNENDGSGGSGGARDGGGSSDESGGGRGSNDGSEKDGRSSEEEDDSECEGQ